MRLFSPREFNELLGGDQDVTDIDVADLRRHTVYSGGYSEHSSAVKAFWNCLDAMSSQEKSAVLKFVTSTTRPPLGGFQHLVPTFTIHKARKEEGWGMVIPPLLDLEQFSDPNPCQNLVFGSAGRQQRFTTCNFWREGRRSATNRKHMYQHAQTA